MTTETEIPFWLAVWAIAATFIVVRHWRTGAGTGLMFSYVFMFGVLHWFAPLMFVMPWHQGAGADITAEGLRQATLATLALAVGSEVAGLIFRHTKFRGHDRYLMTTIDPRLVRTYFVTGLVLYLVIMPFASALPTITAFVSTGSELIIVGSGLHCWNAWVNEDRRAFWFWLLLSAIWPIVTVVNQGFLGFGLASMLTILAFVASFYRPRWRVVAAALLLGYGGLSIYVTYMRDRQAIRDVVWSRAALTDRLAGVATSFTNLELFNPFNPDHLGRIDDRLNQDSLTGAAVAYLQARPTEFARGQTWIDALTALVPRALWPDKPIVGGSGNLVSRYTGIRFAEGTSVGIGQVMEGYVNFGTDGVIGLFLLLGFLLATVDRWAYFRLSTGDGNGFLVWYLPGLCLLQIGGSLSELTASAAAALGMAFILNRIAIYKRWARAGGPDPVDVAVEIHEREASA